MARRIAGSVDSPLHNLPASVDRWALRQGVAVAAAALLHAAVLYLLIDREIADVSEPAPIPVTLVFEAPAVTTPIAQAPSSDSRAAARDMTPPAAEPQPAPARAEVAPEPPLAMPRPQRHLRPPRSRRPLRRLRRRRRPRPKRRHAPP